MILMIVALLVWHLLEIITKLITARIRQYAHTDKRGTNVLGIIEAAEKMGFTAKGVKGGLDSLNKIPLPAITHQ